MRVKVVMWGDYHTEFTDHYPAVFSGTVSDDEIARRVWRESYDHLEFEGAKRPQTLQELQDTLQLWTSDAIVIYETDLIS